MIADFILWTLAVLCAIRWYRHISEAAARREWAAYHAWIRRGGIN